MNLEPWAWGIVVTGAIQIAGFGFTWGVVWTRTAATEKLCEELAKVVNNCAPCHGQEWKQ